ncbi:Asp-tRNA(Asn)/Glu-tRNA(Gln) amidotransferase subunit GatC [Bdellovibrionota bacterium]
MTNRAKQKVMSKEKTTISEEEVRYIADLARLELSGEEVKRLSDELGKIIDYINALNEVDTSSVEPTYSSLGGASRVRDDKVLPSLKRDKFLKTAPEHDEESVVVPLVISSD